MPETLSATVRADGAAPELHGEDRGLAPAIVTINDDDPEPLMSIANVNVVEGATAQVTVSLANTSHDCSANFATADGTATTVGNDYTTNSGSVTFNGSPSTTINIDTNDDPDVEGAETFTVTLSSPGGDLFCGTRQRRRDGDDHRQRRSQSPSLSIADASVTEGTGAGTTTISFDVTTSGVQPANCGYRVVLSHGTTADADFTSPATFDQTATFLTTDSTVTREFDIDARRARRARRDVHRDDHWQRCDSL